MSEVWVVNASPLILLARVDRLDLIERLTPGVAVPDAVISEIRAGLHKDATASRALAWALPYHVPDVPLLPGIEHWDLGADESQVIALCIGRPRWAILDDLAARRCAAAHDVAVVGTLGVVLRAKKSRHIEHARPVVEALRAAGMFMDNAFMNDALSRVGE